MAVRSQAILPALKGKVSWLLEARLQLQIRREKYPGCPKPGYTCSCEGKDILAHLCDFCSKSKQSWEPRGDTYPVEGER